jgi:hypothetical protein
MLFFEEAIEGRTRIGGGTLESIRPQIVGVKKVAEVSLLAISHPLGLRLAAFVVSVRIVVLAVQAAMNIGTTSGAFVAPRDKTRYLQLAAAVMTDHRSLH